VAAALVAGLVATAAGYAGLARGLWAAASVVVLIELVTAMAAKLRRGQVGVDVVALMALAGALLLHEYLAGALIGLMLASGDGLEQLARRRAKRELSELQTRAPSSAHRLEGAELDTIPVDAVRVGDVLVVKSGEVVPVDGVVELEQAIIDESVLTGEALPVRRPPGAHLQSGAVNAGGPIRLRASASAADSAYAAIVRLVAGAQADRAPMVRLADRFALVFVPVTLVASGLAWLLTGSATRALAVLVVATPCPLVLAAPVAIVAGISQAARSGVIVKDGAALEALAAAKVVLFDKTGTLTAGHPRVIGVLPAPGRTAADVLRLAASLDQASPHVLATSLVDEARHRGLALSQPADVTEAPGAGISGVVDEHRVVVGSRTYALASGLPAWAQRVNRRAAREGATSVFVGIDGEAAGAVLLADEIRTDSPRALRALRRAGVERLVMVTGDHAVVAESIGLAIGIDQVFADRTPAEKVAVIRAEAVAGTTLMVGDGVNDAPALAAADVGVAMGARGATASSEAADVVLVVDRLDRLATGVRIATRARTIARQSVVGGMGLSFVAMGVAAFGGLRPAPGALLQEVIDVAAILNSLRVLHRFGRGHAPEQVPDDWARQLHGEHAELRPVLDEVRQVADELESVAPGEARRRLQAVVATVRHDLLDHEHVDEREIYPAVARWMGGDDPLASMSRTHREIFHLGTMLQRLVDDLPDEGPTPSDRVEARRLLYGLDAILRLHFAQEEELFAALAPDQVLHSAAGRGGVGR
jgi:heavy metal translocating P-type ATPase